MDHSLSGSWQPAASISDFWFPFSVSRFLSADFRFLSADFWHLFSDICFLIPVFWFLFPVFCLLMSVFWFLSSGFCYLFSDVCSLLSYHILHWVKEKTAHLINKICCPYRQAFSGLRIDLSAFSFSGFRQPLSVFIRQTNHSALRTWWDACR